MSLGPGAPVKDSRRYPRRNFDRGIGVLCRGEYIIAQGVDLGEGGIAFSSDFVFPEGHKLVLSFQIPGGSFLIVRGQVLKSRKSTPGKMIHGCSFLNISFDLKREIRSFVSARS